MRFVPERLTAARCRAGFPTIAALVESLRRAGHDFAPSTVADWERGERESPRAVDLIILAHFLDIPPMSLFEEG